MKDEKIKIIVEGSIGSGKSYLLSGMDDGDYIIHKQNFKKVREELNDYYLRMKQGDYNCFELQKNIFKTYEDQWNTYEDQWDNDEKRIICYEAIFSNYEVFSKLSYENKMLSEEELKKLKENHSPYALDMKPKLFVYVWCRTKTCLNRLRNRSNYSDTNEYVITIEYLEQVKNMYNKFFEITEEELLKIDNISNNFLMLEKQFKGFNLIIVNNDSDDLAAAKKLKVLIQNKL